MSVIVQGTYLAWMPSINKKCIKRYLTTGYGRQTVCVYIRNDFAFSVRSDLQTDNDEILFVELLLPKTKPIIIGTVYRPPKQNDFLNNFEEILTNLRSDCETMLLGDFNICILQKSNSIFKAYANILKLFDLDQIITEPTRITDTTTSLLDHILCNNKEKKMSVRYNFYWTE